MRLIKIFQTGIARSLIIIAIGVSLQTGCARDDNTGTDTTTSVPGVNFLMFPNPQASVAVGDYSIVADNSSGSAVAYTLTIVSTDGSSQTVTGSIAAGNNNTLGTFEQKVAGGVVISLNSGGTSIALRLCLTGTTCTSASTNVASASGANPSIDLPQYHIDSTTYAQEYYKAVDPLDERTTLATFRTKNGFGTSCAPNGTNEFEVRFRDVLDLGYGRHMCARGSTSAAGDIAFWVENFQVSAIPGNKYGPLNLEAVVNDDRRWHIGTNAIEYSAGPDAGARILKFYTFNPDGTRRLLVDLDGRGAKAMPIPCISCHGGRAPPLLATATAVTGGGGVTSKFPILPDVPRGGTLARMQALNVDTLDFAPVEPYRRVDQEASLKSMNRLVLCTFPLSGGVVGTDDNCRTATANSEWPGTNAAMIKAWYGGDNLPNATQSDTLFMPSGWAAGAEQNIYRSVVAPNCRVCHSLRGNGNQSDIDFMTYAKFTGYADQIKHHVFDKGNMPLALLKFDHFWESSAPTTLASVIPGSTTGGGSALSPTRPVAKPGPDRWVRAGTTKLSAADSINATSYSWSTSSPCSFAAGESTKIRPTLTTANGTCTVQLTVSDGSTTSDATSMTVVVSGTAPTGTTFSNIVTDILRGTPGCHGCHNPSGGYNQIPLYYGDDIDYDEDGTAHDSDDSVPNDTGDLHQLYLNVRARINFTDIENSPILRKPSGNHHCGSDPMPSTGTPGDSSRQYYDQMLSWILAGAPE